MKELFQKGILKEVKNFLFELHFTLFLHLWCNLHTICSVYLNECLFYFSYLKLGSMEITAAVLTNKDSLL